MCFEMKPALTHYCVPWSRRKEFMNIQTFGRLTNRLLIYSFVYFLLLFLSYSMFTFNAIVIFWLSSECSCKIWSLSDFSSDHKQHLSRKHTMLTQLIFYFFLNVFPVFCLICCKFCKNVKMCCWTKHHCFRIVRTRSWGFGGLFCFVFLFCLCFFIKKKKATKHDSCYDLDLFSPLAIVIPVKHGNGSPHPIMSGHVTLKTVFVLI